MISKLKHGLVIGVLLGLGLFQDVLWASMSIAWTESSKVNIQMRHLAFGHDFEKDLDSGLRSKMVFMVEVRHRDEAGKVQVGHKEIIEASAEYDLWEEHFIWTLNQEKTTFKSKPELLSAIENMSLQIDVESDQCSRSSDLSWHLKVLLDPISRQRAKKVNAWVARQTVQNNVVGSARGKKTMDQALFANIFKRMNPSDVLVSKHVQRFHVETAICDPTAWVPSSGANPEGSSSGKQDQPKKKER